MRYRWHITPAGGYNDYCLACRYSDGVAVVDVLYWFAGRVTPRLALACYLLLALPPRPANYPTRLRRYYSPCRLMTRLRVPDRTSVVTALYRRYITSMCSQQYPSYIPHALMRGLPFPPAVCTRHLPHAFCHT